MPDTTLNDFLASGTTTQRLAFTPSPPSPASGPAPGYTWWDSTLQQLYAWDVGSTSWKLVVTGGTGTVTHTAGALTSGQLVYGNGSADLKVVAATDGQIPIGKTSDGTAAFTTITAGTGIGVTNAANAITISTSTAQHTRAITFGVYGGGSALTTSFAGEVYIPYACTITAVTLVADQSGSVQLDIQKVARSSYPGSLASIVASDPPVLSSAATSQDTTLTGWTTSVSAGDVIRFIISSVSTITRLNCVLTVTVS